MANRLYSERWGTLEKSLVTIFADVTIGATGAPTIVTKNSKGLKSITRNSAGDYTMILQDQYYRLLNLSVLVIKATSAAASAITLKAVNTKAAGGASIEFVMFAAAVATDPASGEELLIEIELSNSDAP